MGVNRLVLIRSCVSSANTTEPNYFDSKIVHVLTKLSQISLLLEEQS